MIQIHKLGKFSEAWQDLFAYDISGANGTYIEIGSHKPFKRSNTYNLEMNAGWTGFGIEFSTKYRDEWEQCERKSKIYWADAITFDYLEGINNAGFSNRIGYLSCDIEPPANTFAALQRVIEQGVEFDCITFEHDQYQSDEGFNKIAIDYLVSKGYKVAVTDVYARIPEKIFETWFVKNDIKFSPMSFDDWKLYIVEKLKNEN